MSYRPRYTRRVSKRNKRNLFVTIILVIIILYAAIIWILPNFIKGIGSITAFLKPQSSKVINVSENPQLAPPALNIPFEATNTSQITIEGYGTPNSKVKLFLDDEEVGTENVSAEGKFIFKDVPLSLGTNNIYGKSLDDKGKMSLSSKIIKVTYDNEKPSLEILNPPDGLEVHGVRIVTVEGITEPQAKVYINDNQVIVDKDGKFKVEQSLNDGENIFVIKSVDPASNETSQQRIVKFTP
ncbi:hypothetical protein A3B45_02255 [Candidatus Daviesbacteria bacterium RIFCSPLOWO2_01_FULL_39_12]|uniref:Bacterial Ig domain-containing protein n=1 Tax=Candidatus Daviesbacteria bacterium RIFCSPLOWO2_01_FULL_39_12 TaxID=1797785 RepID=A0A1F5KNN1_9BACT|nr:MAG: hypothetical protein A3B45_02255 [Candidatus Daviesbacteria bacterium RIFCSPLOWO2_01_FULL_39_12]